MGKRLPYETRVDMHKRNTQARCRCGELGDRKVHIAVSWFRGEDEVIWSCSKHCKDFNYLLGNS